MKANEKNNIFGARSLILILVGLFALIGFLYFKVQSLEKKQAVAAQAAYINQQGTVQQAGKIAPVIQTDHIRGNKNAKITLVEYSDFECPSCQTFQPTIKELLQTYGDKIRFITRNFPLPQHANAEKEAEAAECASALGGDTMYWKYSDAIFTRSYSGGTGYSLTNLEPLAKEFGIDTNKFKTCLDSGKFVGLISGQIKDGQNGGAYQMPATFIIDSGGNTKLVGGDQPFAVYKTIIDMDLENI